MKTLPVIPVETLATYHAAAPAPNRNPGIVPPWLQGRPVLPTHPVGDDTPQIFGGAQPTVFDPAPIVIDPETPRIW